MHKFYRKGKLASSPVAAAELQTVRATLQSRGMRSAVR